MQRVTVLFKSGAKATFECEKVDVKRGDNGELKRVSLLGIENGAPLYINVDSVDLVASEHIEQVSNKLEYPEGIDE